MRFGSTKNSGRRAFLRKAGGGILGLPLLEFTHGLSWAQDAVNKRFVTVFSHGGTLSPRGKEYLVDQWNDKASIADRWHPTGLGANFTVGEIQKPVERFQKKMLFVSGVDNKTAIADADYNGDHNFNNVMCLTCADTTGSKENVTALGPSIDAVIAKRLAARQPVRFESIHLMIEGHQYGSPFFRASQQIARGESSPVSAFDRIFAGVTADMSTGPDPAEVRENALRRHVLNGTMEEFKTLRAQVSAHDRQVLDAHFDHLTALSSEIQTLAAGTTAQCVPPTGVRGGEGNVVGSAHAKIIVAALRCGLTNVANLEIADILAPWAPSGLQVDSGYGIGHSLGHLQRDVGQGTDHERRWIIEMVENRQWRMSVMGEILEGLDDPAFSEGGRTILDNSIVYYTSEFGSPEHHSSYEVPTLVFGSAGGKLKQGQHITYNKHRTAEPLARQHESDASYHNLYTTFLQALGENDGHFGNDRAKFKGPLSELFA